MGGLSVEEGLRFFWLAGMAVLLLAHLRQGQRRSLTGLGFVARFDPKAKPLFWVLSHGSGLVF